MGNGTRCTRSLGLINEQRDHSPSSLYHDPLVAAKDGDTRPPLLQMPPCHERIGRLELWRERGKQATTTNTNNMPTPQFSASLEGMEIAIPPSNGNIEQETGGYDGRKENYVRRPALPAPPPKGLAQEPVGSQGTERDFDLPQQRQASSKTLATAKPLPPRPLEVRHRPAVKRQAAVQQPTGHHSSRKISRWMGAEVDVFTEQPKCMTPLGSVNGSSSSSMYSMDELEQRSRPVTPEESSPLRLSSQRSPLLRESRAWQTYSEQQCAVPVNDHRFSDARIAREYHRFANALGARSGFADDCYGAPHHGYNRSSERTASSQSQSSNQQPLNTRCQNIDKSSGGPLSTPRFPPTTERPGSAFESDSDENEALGMIGAIRRLVVSNRHAQSTTNAK